MSDTPKASCAAGSPPKIPKSSAHCSTDSNNNETPMFDRTFSENMYQTPQYRNPGEQYKQAQHYNNNTSQYYTGQYYSQQMPTYGQQPYPLYPTPPPSGNKTASSVSSTIVSNTLFRKFLSIRINNIIIYQCNVLMNCSYFTGQTTYYSTRSRGAHQLYDICQCSRYH